MKAPCRTSYYRYCWDQHDPNIVVVLSPDIVQMPDIEKWGEPGSRVEDSVYVRDFCRSCCDPIRVTTPGSIYGFHTSPLCSGCNLLIERDRYRVRPSALWKTDSLYHGDFYE